MKTIVFNKTREEDGREVEDNQREKEEYRWMTA
jgi:hypothetical protein